MILFLLRWALLSLVCSEKNVFGFLIRKKNCPFFFSPGVSFLQFINWIYTWRDGSVAVLLLILYPQQFCYSLDFTQSWGPPRWIEVFYIISYLHNLPIGLLAIDLFLGDFSVVALFMFCFVLSFCLLKLMINRHDPSKLLLHFLD